MPDLAQQSPAFHILLRIEEVQKQIRATEKRYVESNLYKQ